MGASYNPGGDVVGPASATADAVPRYSGTTGKLVKDSALTLTDAGVAALTGTFTVTASGSAVVPATVRAASSQTAALTEWQNSSGTVGLSVDASQRVAFVRPSTTSTATTLAMFGAARFITASAGSASTQDSVFLGSSAGNTTFTGDRNVGIGQSTAASLTSGGSNTLIGAVAGASITSGASNVCVGTSAAGSLSTGSSNICIGSAAASTLSTGSSNILIGAGTSTIAASTFSIVLGQSAAATASSQLVIGSNAAPITDAYLGYGVTSATASKTTVVLQGSGGSGTDQTGQGIDLAGGKGTGSGVGGTVRIRTATAGSTGTTLQSLATVIECGAGSTLGFYAATPIARPSTAGAAATFTANSGTAVNDASTFDGYTLAQVVKALRNLGLLG